MTARCGCVCLSIYQVKPKSVLRAGRAGRAARRRNRTINRFDPGGCSGVHSTNRNSSSSTPQQNAPSGMADVLYGVTME